MHHIQAHAAPRYVRDLAAGRKTWAKNQPRQGLFAIRLPILQQAQTLCALADLLEIQAAPIVLAAQHNLRALA